MKELTDDLQIDHNETSVTGSVAMFRPYTYNIENLCKSLP